LNGSDLAAIFGPQGVLAAVFEKYEHRPGQLQMAEHVRSALADREVALIEAPTGTGKTIAYLVPVLLADRRVVVSTGTKALQEQIVTKDVPLAESVLGRSIKAVVMKGRQNYVCRYRLKHFLAQPEFASRDEASLWKKIERWAELTQTGDRAEISDLPDDYQAWKDICSSPNTCVGVRCQHNRECFITKMRGRAAAADLIVVNHHLLFADLAVKMSSGGEGQVIPTFDAVICDEAHQIEETATSYFGEVTSSFRFEEWERDLARVLAGNKIVDHELTVAVSEMRLLYEGIFKHYRGLPENVNRFRPEHCTTEILELLAMLTKACARIGARLEALGAKKEIVDFTPLSLRVGELARITDDVCAANDPGFVYWREVRPRSVILHKAPIDLSGAMQDSLFTFTTSVVFTSATLASGDSFAYIKDRLGIGFDCVEAQLPTCFDYQRQGVMYLPKEMPDPANPAFLDAILPEIEQLIRASGGRAFCLFTSIRNMTAAYEALKDKLPFPCMLQGQAPKHLLIEKKRAEPETVLFATASFWEGVDIAGDALRLVIVDKLPFASPGDPLVEARIEHLHDEGKNPFMEYQLPAAIIMLKQGLGRLIRTADDRGVLALMDTRIRTRRYGSKIMASLPPFPKTSKLSDVVGYLQTLSKE